MTDAGRLLAGQIGKPHGTGGEVYVVRISDDPHRFDPGSALLHEDGRTLIVASARAHRDRFLVRFEGIASRDEAERLRGALYVDAGARRELSEGEFWVDDVAGCEVFDPEGRKLGVVRAVLPGVAQDLFEVETPGGERVLVPYVDAIVTSVDVAARRVVVDPPEGLMT